MTLIFIQVKRCVITVCFVPIKSRIEQLAEGYQEGFDQNLMKDQREKKNPKFVKEVLEMMNQEEKSRNVVKSKLALE